MHTTKLDDMADQYSHRGSALVHKLATLADGRSSLILSTTLFHPQGGGQPADHGTITGPDGLFMVSDVRFVDGIVHYFRTCTGAFITRAAFVSPDELATACHFVLPNIPDNKPTRVVTVWGNKGIPCGGTHVADIAEVGIRKIKAAKGVIKVSYELQPQP